MPLYCIHFIYNGQSNCSKLQENTLTVNNWPTLRLVQLKISSELPGSCSQVILQLHQAPVLVHVGHRHHGGFHLTAATGTCEN